LNPEPVNGYETMMPNTSNIKPIGQMLMEALTAGQVAQLLTAIFPSGDQLERCIEALEAIDADLASTLRVVTTAADAEEDPDSRPQPVRRSLQRDLERWKALWRQWDAHVIELGDEEGGYAHRDNHWDPPYFDGYTLASDLEAVAEEMLPLIDTVFEAVGDPDLLLEAFEEVENRDGRSEPPFLPKRQARCHLGPLVGRRGD